VFRADEFKEDLQQHEAPKVRIPRVLWLVRNGVSQNVRALADRFETMGWRVKLVEHRSEAEEFIEQTFVHCVICCNIDVAWLSNYNLEYRFQRIYWAQEIFRQHGLEEIVTRWENVDKFEQEKDLIAALQLLYNSLGEFKKEEAKTFFTEILAPSSPVFRDVKYKMEHNWDSSRHIAVPRLTSIQLHNHMVLDPVLETFEPDRMKRVRLWLALSRDRYEDVIKRGLSMDDAKNLEFGNGIYLTTCASKAFGFVSSEVGRENTVLVLCDVALGTRYVATRKHENFEAKHRSGYNSVVVQAVSGLVKHDQYVVFDPARVVIRFTVGFQ